MPVLVERFTPRGPGCAPGSIAAGSVPLTLEFDPCRIIGRADLSVDDVGVWATLEHLDRSVAGLYPAIGGIVERGVGDLALRFTVLELSLCASPNVDPTIPPL